MSTYPPPNLSRIVLDADILAYKPMIRGTRIPVSLVLAHLANDLHLDELFAAFPRLTRDDVRAVLAYAADVVARGGFPSDAELARRCGCGW